MRTRGEVFKWVRYNILNGESESKFWDSARYGSLPFYYNIPETFRARRPELSQLNAPTYWRIR